MFFRYLGLTLSRCLHQTQPLLAGLLGSCQGPVSGLPLLEVGVLSSTLRRPHPWCPEPGGLFLLKLNTAPPQGPGHSPGHTWAFPPPLGISPACSTLIAVPPFLRSFTPSPYLGRCTSWVHSPPAESVPGTMGRGHLAENLPCGKLRVPETTWHGALGLYLGPSFTGDSNGWSFGLEVLETRPGLGRGSSGSTWCLTLPGLVWGQGVHLMTGDPGQFSMKCDPNKQCRVQHSRAPSGFSWTNNRAGRGPWCPWHAPWSSGDRYKGRDWRWASLRTRDILIPLFVIELCRS